jgi:two-component system, OmpR family, phosphate regulon sensor histidine kinase PhoR
MRSDDQEKVQKQIRRRRVDPAQQQVILKELDHMKGALVSRMSHEFRTPLTSILGFAELIVDDPDMSAQTCKKFARIILTEGERLSSLINNLLDLSLIEKGGLTTRMHSENIVPIIEDVIVSLVPQARPKLLTITSDFQGRCIEVCIDKNHFREIVHQLLANAIKFTPAGGHIWIGAEANNGSIETWIRDTGSGISRNDLPYIFQKFYRAQHPGDELPGAGLGLAIVKQLVELQGGSVSVRSKENVGSTFILRFPRSETIPDTPAESF